MQFMGEKRLVKFQYKGIQVVLPDKRKKYPHCFVAYDFMRWNKISLILSILLLIFSIISIYKKGFNLSMDFTGGTVIEIQLEKPVDLSLLRKVFINSEFTTYKLKKIGYLDIILNLSNHNNYSEEEIGNKILSIINKVTSQRTYIKRIELIGPSIGPDISQSGIAALLIALFCILIYVGIRFEWHLAMGVVLSLIHDIIITLGIVSYFHLEIDLTIIASLMSIIGYSLNDSIVVSDRIRENFRRICCTTPYEIINISLTQVSERTLITSFTNLVVILILLVLGGELLQGFALIMLIGISIGTLSSICVASSIALILGLKHECSVVNKTKKQDNDYPFIYF